MGNKKRIPSRPAPAFIRVRQPALTCPVCGKVEVNVQHLCTKCWMEVPFGDRQQIYQMSHRGMNTEAKVAQVVQKLKESRPQLGSLLGVGQNRESLISRLQQLAQQTPEKP